MCAIPTHLIKTTESYKVCKFDTPTYADDGKNYGSEIDCGKTMQLVDHIELVGACMISLDDSGNSNAHSFSVVIIISWVLNRMPSSLIQT